MLSHPIKHRIESSFNKIQINLENNYKDLAITARKDTEDLLQSLHKSGELPDKYYEKYAKQLNEYTKKMGNYHH